MKTLQELFYSLIDLANANELTRFVFEYKKDYYISEWIKAKWSEPQKITRLI